jgi:hypothetical protein
MQRLLQPLVKSPPHRGGRGVGWSASPLDSELIDQSDPRRIRAEILIPRRFRPSSGTVCPAVYKTAALPTEIHRRVTRCVVADPRVDVRILSLTCESTRYGGARWPESPRRRVRLAPAEGGRWRPSVPNTCPSSQRSSPCTSGPSPLVKALNAPASQTVKGRPGPGPRGTRWSHRPATVPVGPAGRSRT